MTYEEELLKLKREVYEKSKGNKLSGEEWDKFIREAFAKYDELEAKIKAKELMERKALRRDNFKFWLLGFGPWCLTICAMIGMMVYVSIYYFKEIK